MKYKVSLIIVALFAIILLSGCHNQELNVWLVGIKTMPEVIHVNDPVVIYVYYTEDVPGGLNKEFIWNIDGEGETRTQKGYIAGLTFKDEGLHYLTVRVEANNRKSADLECEFMVQPMNND